MHSMPKTLLITVHALFCMEFESIPSTVLNGVGGSISTNTSTQQGDSRPFSDAVFNQSALPDPDITVGLRLDQAADDQIAVTVEMVNQGSIEITEETRLYIAVVEKTVEDVSGILIQNMLRKLLPDGSGIELDVDDNGNIQPVSQSWNIQKVQDADNLAVVAWIQNTDTKSVIQAASVDVGDKADDIVTAIGPDNIGQ